MEGHSHSDHSGHSDCQGHSHGDVENQRNSSRSSGSKGNKLEIIWAILSVLLVIGGTLIKVYIFSDFIELGNDQYAYSYIAWFLLIMMLLSYYRTTSIEHSQTFMEGLLGDNPKRHFNINMKQFKTRCEFCNKMKFERSSHCTTCNVCVTRRDHHCIWIRKCVGYTNNQFFINYCIWVWLSGIHYISGFVNFYNTQYELAKKNSELFDLPIYTQIFVYLYTVVMISGTFGISAIILSQINAIFNEASFNERRKDPHLETYYLCCQAKTYEQNKCFGYNKGFVNNFYNIIGPSLFHFLFPISKFSREDFPENDKVFAKMKNPHPFEVRRHLMIIKPQMMTDIQEEERKEQDPNNFVEVAKNKYKEHLIV